MIILDSRNAVFTANNTYRFQFEQSILIDNDIVKASACVSQFTMPNSIYNVNTTNNFLSITFNSTTVTWTVTPGNYNAYTFIAAFQSQYSSNGFSMTLNQINNILTITNTTYNFTINSSSTIYQVLGFSKNTSYTSSSLSLTLPYTCNFSGIQNINIYWMHQSKNFDSFNASSSSVIQSIQVDPNETIIQYNRSYDFGFTLYDRCFDFIDIYLLDDLGNVVNLNGQYFNMTIEITTLKNLERFEYEKTFFSELQKKYYENI